MTRYRVLIQQEEYRNVFVDANSPEQAHQKALDGDETDSESVGEDNTEVITVEVWE